MKRGVARVVTKGAAEIGDRVGQRIFGDELGLPHSIDDLKLFRDFTLAPSQKYQKLHQPQLELHRRRTTTQPVETRLHQPLSDLKSMLRCL